MRGWDSKSEALFSYVSCEARVPKDHPLRAILRIVDGARATLSPEFPKTLETFRRDACAAQIGGVAVTDQPQIRGMSVH
jgi:hypothetical protein